MDILDVSDEELAPLQAFVDEIKSDLSGDGDVESEVEQVPEASCAFLRSLPSYMKQIQEIQFDKYDSEWAVHSLVPVYANLPNWVVNLIYVKQIYVIHLTRSIKRMDNPRGRN